MTGRWRSMGAAALLSIALLVALYAGWGFVQAREAVGQALDAGQLSAEENQFEIASYLMSSSGDHAIAAITLAALGWLLLQTAMDARRAPVHDDRPLDERPPADDADDDLDDLLSEMPPEASTR